jgi:hypothetical protein
VDELGRGRAAGDRVRYVIAIEIIHRGEEVALILRKTGMMVSKVEESNVVAVRGGREGHVDGQESGGRGIERQTPIAGDAHECGGKEFGERAHAE